jgi:hypothetical protein
MGTSALKTATVVVRLMWLWKQWERMKTMAEKECIEREAFLEQKREQYCKDCARRKGMRNGKYKTLYEIGEAPCRACEIDDVLNDVEDFPAADVRPVVLCQDCKHFQVNVSPSGYLTQGVPEWECRHWCRPTDQTDFCSYGEKREER